MGVIFGGVVVLVLLGIGANWDPENGPIIVVGLIFIGAIFVPGSMLTLGAIQEMRRRASQPPGWRDGPEDMLIGGLMILAVDAGLAWVVFGVLT